MTTRRNARRRLLPFATATPTSRPRNRVKEARGKRSETKHQLNVQTLEKRELLAVDLVSISADVTEQFDVATVNRLSTAPSQLTFRFDGDAEIDPASLSAFQFTAAGGDGTFGDGNETVIEPGFIGLGSSDRIVIARFAETLPDDLYRVEISADPINGLRDVDGGLLTAEVDVLFDVEVGPRVLAVVPQPILGGVGSRIFANDQIQVFFNNDPLSRVSAGAIDSTSSNLPVVNPENYKLILTRDTIEPTLPANVGDPVDPNDDVTIPTRVDYDPVRNLATLTFGAPLSSIAGGDGTFRLRIGSNNALPMPPSEIAVTEFNAGVSDNTFAGAQNQGAGAARFVAGGGIQSLLFTGGEIESTGQYVMAWPGAYDTPGVRDQRRDSKVTRNDDTTIGINIFPYNFAELYGTDPQGNLLSNAITPAQKQRIRETLDLYEEHLGVQFVETEDAGLQFVTGDLRGIQQTADTGAGDGTPMSLYRINEVDPSRGVLVLDAGEPFYDGYGISPDDRPSYFVEAIRGVGNVLGIGDLFELPGGTDGAVGSQDEPNSELFSNDGDGGLPGTAGFPDVPAEPDFLSHAAQVIGKAIHRPESSDVDFYAFEVDPPTGGGEIAGSVTIETFAQRLDESSLLDTQLQLYRVNGPVGSEQYEWVARNDDSFGHDSLVKLDLAPGKYVVGVSAKGNDNYNGQIDGSGIDGRSEGAYELRVTFENVETAGSGNPSSITDLSGTLLDGDADGVAGGDFNFWFRVAPDSLGGGARTIFVSKDADGSAAGVGTLASPLDTIEAALDIAEPDDIIRLLPSSGADGDLTTVLDNNAYELGRGGPNNLVLSDGEVLEVPQGVTVMIDAGAILKLRDSKIIAGSDSVDDDRSLASIQVLGTPENSVVFTSYNDQTFGVDTNPTSTTPQAGDWGGIEFRSDVDLAEGRGTYAEEGIFVNYVSHADIRFGGGRVDQAATSTSPIKLTQARPSLIYNTISNSADAAISADPDSFREDNFHAPRYQRVTPFTSDYQRVGPDLAGNILRDNSINALSIRVETEPGEQLEVLSVSGRLDDTDITHTLSQTLTIAGNPGGPELLEDRPDVLAVTLGPRIGGGLNPGVYEYVLSYVTVEGSESLISLPTRQVDLAGGGSVELANLPPAPEEFAGRRLYRGRVGGGMMQYELVTTLDGSSSRYLDTGELRGGIAASATRPAVNMMMPPVAGSGGGQLQRDLVYDYRFTFLDVFGGESPASEPTVSTIALQDGTITLSDIPQPPADDDRFLGTHVYRLNPTTGRYIRIETLREGETDFVDIGLNPADFPGSLLGQELGSDADGGSRLLPRFDARLTIDPGIVLKFDTSRIEATFGADFYAEGVAGKPIHFTSLADDTVGAGGTFDASSNNDDVVATAGDWGGIMLRQGVTGSLDFVEQRYAGGVGSIEGGLADFNPLEILQADVRVTNSVFQFNADGVDPNTDAQDIRVGRGSNTAATIFVRGAQPILIGNIIDDGTGAAISINPDALTDEAISDRGRSTGAADQFVGRLANQGPLIQENQINAHAINGLEIRGEIVTRDTVWDDTGITHVVEEPIYSLTGSFGGALRLRSAVNQSLVVKFGENGTLIGGGRPLDIEDRIGGTLQILGSDAFPVVLTSLLDDSIGAGFTPDGDPLNQTLGNPPTDDDGNVIPAAAGDWVGLQLQSYINDRNVAYVYESEIAEAAAINSNASPDDAQTLGGLAVDQKGGDENRRLGIQLRGVLATPADVDTYAFTASGRTRVVIDIDETESSLDTVIEVVTGDGEVIARSDNSLDESVGIASIFVDESLPEGVVQDDVRPLETSTLAGNVESPNRRDAGLAIVLPGDASEQNEYFVRVRTAAGLSSGQYTMSLRLGDDSETAGSTVRRADIRFATRAIQVDAAPLHSPLVGDAAEEVSYIDPTPGDRNSGDEQTRETANARLSANPAQAQDLGNLLTSDRGSLVVTGELGNISNLSVPALYNSLLDERLEDVDVYRVDLFTQQIEPDVFDNENRFVTTTFDIDYADQLGRPNTVLSVFDGQGRLILVGRDSNIADDVSTDPTDLDAGSAGTLDAYIGPVELPEGTYFVAVSNEAVVPRVLNQFFEENPTEGNTRLMPLNSVRRIGRDSFEEDDFNLIGFPRVIDYTAEEPTIEPLFSEASAVPYTLDDIRLFVSYDTGISGSNQTSIASFNPFTGTMERLIGQSAQPTGDLAIRRDGELYTYSVGPEVGVEFNNASVGNYINISAIDGGARELGDDGIVFRQSNEGGDNTENQDAAQLIIEAIAYPRANGTSSINRTAINQGERFWVVGTRDAAGRGGEVPQIASRNILYSAQTTTGVITSLGSTNANADRDFDGQFPYSAAQYSSGSNEIEFGIIDTGFGVPGAEGDGGTITGLAIDPTAFGFGDTLVGVTDLGGIHVFNSQDNVTVPTPDGLDFNASVIPTTYHGRLPAAPDHFTASFDPLDPSIRFPVFSGLSFGPQFIEGQAYQQTLFATTPDGWLYAFDLSTDLDGNPSVEPAHVFYDGRYAVQLTFLFGGEVGQSPHGLAFSNLEVNPWHLTNDRFDDIGHGQVTNYDLSREPLAIGGGNSLYFGFEITADPADNTVARPENDALGDISPGGAHGSVISDSFDLSEYSEDDKPTLYFSYNLEVEANDDFLPGVRLQRDSFRVFGAGDDGQWRLLATNNDFRELPLADEYDYFFQEGGSPVQEIFDDAGADQWRQVRADLSPLAGSRDVRIRFDFSTAGSMRSHFGSVELIGIDGEVVPDNDLVTLSDQNFNGTVLQTIVGTDLVLPAGNQLADGNTFTVVGAGGDRTVVEFVSVAGTSTADVEILINPLLDRQEVALAVATALPASLRASIDSDATISLLAARSIEVGPNLLGGQASPERLVAGERTLLITPNGDLAVEGETITLSTFGPDIVLTFVRSANATGAAGEIVFDSGDTDAAIALRVADAINAGLGAGTALAVGGDVQMLTNFVTITLGAGPSALVVTPLNAGNVQTRLSLAVADQLNDDEVLLFNDGVNNFAIVLDDDFNVPAGVVPDGTVSATVAFTDATNPTTLQNDIIAAINTIAPQVTPVADGTDILIRVESFSSQQAPTLISSTQTTGLQINFPRASELINGEQIFLNTPLGVRTVTFNQSATASSLGQVNYQLGPSTPRAQLVSDFANVALDANLDIGFDGEKAILYGMTETDIILGDPNSRFTFSEIEAVEIDVPAGAGLNDRETLQVVAAAGSPEAALTNTNTLELRDTDTFAGPLDPNDFGFQRSLTDEQVRDNLLAVLSPLGVATDGTTDRLLVPGSNTVITTPASGFVTLRFESFVNVTVPDGDEIRDGEVLEVFGGGVTTTLTFLRIGTPVPPLTGPTIFFDETSTSAELSQQIVARLNAISATFNALVTNDGFGLGIDDAEVRIIVDPILSEIGLADAVDTYAIPMTLPAGNQITPGEQFTVFAKDSPRDQVGQTYTFVTVPSGASREIVFNPGSSPEQVAFAVAAALDPNLGAQLSAGGSRSLLLQGASSLRTAPGSNIVSFEAAVDTGINFGADTRAIPVIVNALEDSAEVTLALQKALADSLGYFANEDFFAFGTEPLETNATAFDYKAYVDDRIRLYATTVFDPGPFGLSELLPGDEFGLGVPISFSPNQIGTQGAQNNEIEGVYIDDIIVGFAERGEAVLYEDYLTRAGDTTFVIDPAYVPDSRPDSIQPENPDEVLVGPYTLEIRTADEYGVPQDYDPINLVLDETISSGRSIDPNDRLADGATTLLFPDGDQLIDGDRFVIDNGVRAVTFEFNSVFDDRPATEAVDPGSVLVPFSVGDSAFEVAASARDAINQFRLGLGDAPSVFDVVARTGDSRSVGVSTSARVELFGDDITINPGSGRTLKVDAVEAETPFGEFSTRRIPIVDQDLGTVNYAQYIFETGNATVPYYRPGDTLIVSGKIGDQVRKGVENEVSADDGQILFTDPTTDLDVVRVYLEAGTPIEIDVDTIELSRDSNGLELPIVTVLPSGTQLDAAGLVFENSPVAVSSLFAPTSAPGESIGGAYLTFTPTESRYYDIVVSSLGAYGGFFGLSAIDRLSGDYQMTLRPLGDPAVPTRDVIGVDYQFGQTDVNRTRDQGQLLIENNIISDSSEVGINATLGDRGQAGTTTANVLPILGPGLATGVDDFTRPGAARLLRNENPFDLIPGTVIVNNLVQRSGDAAIVFGGGTFDNGESAAPNLFGRIVNNTLIGNEDDAGVDSGTGIRVSGRSAPTLLNNVLVNLDSGINVDTTNASLTETAGNVFAEVNTPSTLPIDATSLVLTDATGLFVDSDRGIYIPQANSVLVDSSIQSLPDRSELFDTVKEPVGIAPSPLLAPGFDALGQLRVDGPGGGGGAGGDSFVDRGAFERTDNIGPEARLTVPLDAVGIISTEGDADAAPAVVRLVEDLSFPFFEVELSDDGVGIDPATVSPASVVLREDGVVLREGLDYLFGYSSAGTTIRLTSTRGEFRRDATYEIQIRNVQDRLGNDILETNAIGQTQLTIITSGVNFDYGDAPESYLTTAAQGGPSHANPGVGSPRLGDRVDTEADGAASANADSDDIPQSLSATSSGAGLVVSADVGELEINIVSVPSIGERVSFNLAGERFTVEFTRPDVNPTIGNLVVDLDDDPTVDEVATVLRDLIDDQITQRGITAGLVDTGTPTVIRLESRDDEDGVSTGVFTTNSGESYTVFGVPAPDGSIDQSSAQGVLSPGGTTTFIVRATDVLPGQTFLDLWIDFGGDGTFGTSDKIEIEDSLVEGDNPITVTTPAGVTAKETFMRLRISTVGGLSPNGVVSGGEVEDYPISIAPDDLGLPVNNQPTFATASPLDIPEADTDDPRVFTNFLTNILPGGPDNAVENANQIVVDFTVTNLVDAGGILLNDPVVIYNDGDSEASIQIESRTDTFGQISFTVTAIDDHPTNPRTRSEDVTVNVRPVNDAPRLNPAISSQSDRSNSQDLNDSYVVDDSLPLITFTLREDNVGPNLISQPYFIPLNQPSGVGYNRIGLLDLFTAGPTNEIDASPGGSQVLSLTRLGPDPNVDINAGPVATTLGGTVDPVFENGNLIGVNYTPPADVNENFAALDSFVYEVTDDSPVGGETFDIETGTLIEDNIGTEGRVQFRLLPINDRPEFTIGQVQAIPEDASPVLLEQFAQGIAAGPAGAFDENDVTGGQNVSFSITSLTFGQQLADRFFTIYPSIDASSGNLIFQAAPDVYGTFDFEVVLTDDGPSPSSSNPNGNVNTSVPATLTLKINPTNDPPQIDPSADPISATIQEDTSTAFVIDDLLAAFRPGPAANTDFVVETDPTDESIDGKIGGGQTITLTDPLPTTSSAGGSITQETIMVGGVAVDRLVYTPPDHFVGRDTFVYTVTDDGISVVVGGDLTNPADRISDPRIAANTVSIDVTPVNDRPEFSGAQNVTVDEDSGQVSIENWATNVRSGPATAFDEIDSQTLNFDIAYQSGDASIVVGTPSVLIGDDGNADLQFETAADASGSVTYTVQLVDSGDGMNATNLREFTITINEVNDLPEFTMTTNAITVREDSGAYTAEQINDFSTGPANEQDQTISFEVELVEPADAEKFDQQPQIDATGILRFVIARDANTFDGDIPIRITARDSGGDDTDPTTNTSAPQTFTLSITPVNDSPTAGPVQVNGNEDELLTIPFSTLFAQASDPDLIEGDFLTVNLLTPDGGNSKPTGSGGEVRIDLATQTLIYDPTDDQSLLQTLGDGQSQNDTFSFQLIDSVGAASNTGLVTIAVEGRNDAPRVSNDAPTLANNGPTRVDVLANDVDIDGTIVRSTLEITFEPSFGTVEIDPQTREVVYTPVSSSNNDDFFRYTVRDEDGATSLEGEVTLSVNAAPVAVDDEFTTLAGTEVTFDVLANDFDNDGTIDPSSIDVTLPSRGQLARNADNTFTYLPNAQFVGTDSFTYTVVDNGGRISERASVSITVLASTLQNADSNSDVNDDGRVTPIDALLVLNHLRRNGTNSIPVLPTDSPLVSNDPLTFRYYDVSGDQRITPLDALQVINQIRRDRSGGDAEGEWLGGTTNSVSDDVVDSLAIDQIDSDDRDRRNGSNPFDAAFREDWLS